MYTWKWKWKYVYVKVKMKVFIRESESMYTWKWKYVYVNVKVCIRESENESTYTWKWKYVYVKVKVNVYVKVKVKVCIRESESGSMYTWKWKYVCAFNDIYSSSAYIPPSANLIISWKGSCGGRDRGLIWGTGDHSVGYSCRHFSPLPRNLMPAYSRYNIITGTTLAFA